MLLSPRTLLYSSDELNEFVQSRNPGLDGIFKSDVAPEKPARAPGAAIGGQPAAAPVSRPSVLTYTPSTAPVVKPPTTPITHSPTRAGNIPARVRSFGPGLQAPDVLNASDPLLLEPKDAKNRPLYRCSSPDLDDGTELGSFRERGYTAQVKECLTKLDASTYDLACLGLQPKFLAGSYDAETRKICRCGGLPMRDGLCVNAKRVQFNYVEDVYRKANGDPTCSVDTKWIDGRFKEGRYHPPGGCTLLDMNPRSIVKRFPNKLIFFDGDSHQSDKFWGFLAEMRNQRLFFKSEFGDQWGKDIRYEITEGEDRLELDYYGKMKLGDPDMRRCRISSPCTIFIYRFDRTAGEYIPTATSFGSNPPDYYVAAWISKAYSFQTDTQLATKAAWLDVINKSTHPISIAWTSFPMNAGFIIDDVTAWLKNLTHPNVRQRFALTEHPLWGALEQSPGEAGGLTLFLTWHDNCRIGDASHPNGKFDKILASETCHGPVPKTMYRIILSLFAMAP